MKTALTAMSASSVISTTAAIGTGMAGSLASIPQPSEWMMLTIGIVLIGSSDRAI